MVIDGWTLGAEGQVVESSGGDLEATGGSADVVEAVLQKIDLNIGLFFHCFELLQAHLLQVPQSHRLLSS